MGSATLSFHALTGVSACTFCNYAVDGAAGHLGNGHLLHKLLSTSFLCTLSGVKGNYLSNSQKEVFILESNHPCLF